jgi:hypothetical protein
MRTSYGAVRNIYREECAAAENMPVEEDCPILMEKLEILDK